MWHEVQGGIVELFGTVLCLVIGVLIEIVEVSTETKLRELYLNL